MPNTMGAAEDITGVKDRILSLEKKQADIEKRISELAAQIDENTQTTNAIKKDTTEIVALFRASQLGATIVKWCATVGGGLIVAYAAIKGLGFGR